MKRLTFTVEIDFTESINENEVEDVCTSILEALKYEVDMIGMAPEDSEGLTERIKVSNDVTKFSIEHKF